MELDDVIKGGGVSCTELEILGYWKKGLGGEQERVRRGKKREERMEKFDLNDKRVLWIKIGIENFFPKLRDEIVEKRKIAESRDFVPRELLRSKSREKNEAGQVKEEGQEEEG